MWKKHPSLNAEIFVLQVTSNLLAPGGVAGGKQASFSHCTSTSACPGVSVSSSFQLQESHRGPLSSALAESPAKDPISAEVVLPGLCQWDY